MIAVIVKAMDQHSSRGSRLLIRASVVLLLPMWLFTFSHVSAHVQTSQTQQSSSPLEIRLTEPVHWGNGCLSISLDRINNSSVPLFLPDMGLYISGSVNEVPNGTERKSQKQWLNFYGAADFAIWEAVAIAPGGVVHDEYCLPRQMPVTNFKARTHREIALRGMLRIDAYYFLTEADWKKNKTQHEHMLRIPPAQWKTMTLDEPKVVTIFSRIPCQVACGSGCDNPPPIMPDEQRAVPDVFAERDWDVRGKVVGDELARKFPACPDASSSPH